MPIQPALPPPLVPYLSSLSPSSLTLISSVLAATGNWLVLRYLHAALSSPSSSNADLKKRKVVLVSFLRGWEFWRTEAKRLGLDLARLTDKREFAFIDGLSQLFFTPAPETTVSSTLPASVQSVRLSSRMSLPIRPQPDAIPSQSSPIASNLNPSRASPACKQLHFSSSNPTALDALETDVASVIESLRKPSMKDGEQVEDETEVLLVIDQPDLFLAATGPGKGLGATEMGNWVMGLRQHAYATILTLSADSPLIHASTFDRQNVTPLETEHAAFVVGLSHQARIVMQLRNLETGAASDVSGVLRVSKGGTWEGDETSAEGNLEKEVLYFVQRDGGVRVFERGE